MDAIASRRFLVSNVVWPADKFFIPHGGLLRLLHDNLWFKVFLVMSALFTDAYVSTAVPTLTTPQRQEIRYRMRDIVRHMRKFSAWTFHVILAMLRVVGFEGDGEVVAAGECPVGGHPTEGKVAYAQADFFLGAALATCTLDEQCNIPVTFDYADYDTDGLMTQFFYRGRRPMQLHLILVFDPSKEDYVLADLATTWMRPTDIPVGPAWRFEPLTDAEAAANAVVTVGVVATVAAVEQIQAQESASNGKADPTLTPTRCSRRLLSAQLTASESLAEDEVRSVRKRVPRIGSPPSAHSSKRSSRFRAAVDASLAGGNWSHSPPFSADYYFPSLFFMAAVPRLPLSATCRIITQLLLQPADLGNPDWMPNIPITEFLCKHVQPVAYFLQRSMCEEWGFVGPMVELPQEEAESVQALLLLLVGTLRHIGRAKHRVAELLALDPLVITLILLKLSACWSTRAISHNSALPIDFPEYDAAGNLLDLEGGFYFPPMAS
ncbi:hypothetical protein B0H17DRAFT_1193776 [Mycena rosella]|uniref:Uncharacterized protein n=1 Tax=Mycena rosella TaxID=1033263 RepID=A0AAD7GSX4_MYCRO|nr:hypothetical protein B0H17DRAFT_1193776 [Mycena rosella]